MSMCEYMCGSKELGVCVCVLHMIYMMKHGVCVFIFYGYMCHRHYARMCSL